MPVDRGNALLPILFNLWLSWHLVFHLRGLRGGIRGVARKWLQFFLCDRMQEGERGTRRRLKKDKLDRNPDEMEIMLFGKGQHSEMDDGVSVARVDSLKSLGRGEFLDPASWIRKRVDVVALSVALGTRIVAPPGCD